MHKTQNIKLDLKDFTLCYQCGPPNDLRSCGRCHAAFYCARNSCTGVQKDTKNFAGKKRLQWESMEKELASNRPHCGNEGSSPPIRVSGDAGGVQFSPRVVLPQY